MQESTAYVGLDVHKDSITVALALAGAEPVDVGQVPNEPTAVRRIVERLARRHPHVAFAYEAGPRGYDLHRQMGHSCLVAAPSLMPRRPGDHVKTDRRDARMLARLLRSGDLTAVWVPDPRHEAIRELVRCREDFKQSFVRGFSSRILDKSTDLPAFRFSIPNKTLRSRRRSTFTTDC